MFEQAVLRPAPVRGWAVMLSFAGELALVGCILAAPLIWPQLLRRHEVMAWITAPLPPPPFIREAPLVHFRPMRAFVRPGALWYAPRTIPQSVPQFDEPPGQRPGVPGGSASSPADNPFAPIFDSAIRIEPPKRPAEPAAPPKIAPVQQVKVSGTLQAARLVRRVDPVYPALARQARIAGTVELAGVIGTNGQIRELRVVSGPALLVNATLEAVRQWIYQPTLLGGNPVEVITTISVVFRLN